MATEKKIPSEKSTTFKATFMDRRTSNLEIDVNTVHDAWKQSLPYAVEMIKETILELFADPELAREGSPAGQQEISVLLTGDDQMAELNNEFRGKSGPTNVLSFSNHEKTGSFQNASGSHHLGDIVLGFETLCREAEERNISLDHHLRHLTIHGLLHLLGYDHSTPEMARNMEALEVRVLMALGVNNPYQDQAMVKNRIGG